MEAAETRILTANCRSPSPAGSHPAAGGRARTRLALLDTVATGRDTLLIAPTGGGKTLAGFLPSLVDLAAKGPEDGARARHPHALRLAAEGARHRHRPQPRNARRRDGRCPSRSRRAPATRRRAPAPRQRVLPPDILLTTPEQIALMLSHESAAELFGSLKCVILDELHALATSKRGDLLGARSRAPAHPVAAISRPSACRPRWRGRPSSPPSSCRISGQTATRLAEIVTGAKAASRPTSPSSSRDARSALGRALRARYALPEIYAAIKAHRMSLMFVNTRSQAEMLFHELWRCNDDNLAIALHHGSLDVGQRRKVEAAMVAGKLRAVVCTSTLDLGIDWGDVDLVINVGAPKGASRLMPAHRPGQSPARRAEQGAAGAGQPLRGAWNARRRSKRRKRARRTPRRSRPGALDVLAQHILGMACAGPVRSRRALSPK